MNSIAINFVDCAIIVLYLIFIIWWGLRNGKSSDAGSYFLAGRTMPWWIVGLSLFAASISSTTLIGQSGDAYHTGVAVFNYNLTGVVVMVFFATFLLPLYIRSGIFTIPEFLERRFDKRSRYYFSGICIVGNIFLDAAGALYAAALIIKLLFPEADLQLIIIIFAVLAASYTIPGGLSSAINAELIQAVILIVGSVILTGACFANGGFDYLASLFESGDMSVRLIRPLTDTATPWLGLIVGMPVLGIYFWANNQTLVQRVLSARSVDEGRKGVMFAGALTLATLFIIVFPGVIARHLFPGIEKPDMIYPTMVLRLLPTGLLGIMLSALLAALTSTLSAILNSTSTLFTMDFYAKIGARRQAGFAGHHRDRRPLGSADRTFRFAAQILPGDALLHCASRRGGFPDGRFLAPRQRAGSLCGADRRTGRRGSDAPLAHGDLRRDALSADRAVPAGLQPVGDLGRKPYGSRAPARQTDRHDLFGGGFPG